MMDFSDSLVGSWFAGLPPEIDRRLLVVEFEGRLVAYFIDIGHLGQFFEWISKSHDEDNPRRRKRSGGFAEKVSEHLARIGCNVTFREWQV